MKPYVLFLVGPTGCGKSDVALALAKKIGGEIVSCDSAQVYRGMDIGTAKPTSRERRLVQHHLIDLVSPRRDYSVFEHRKRALEAFQNICERSKIPIAAGGSGLYVKAILDGLAPQPARAQAIWRKWERLAETRGLRPLYARLKKVDPKRARQIHPNDQRRIIRALEIFELSRRRPSDWERETKSLDTLGFRPVLFGLMRGRSELYERIEQRVDRMFEAGWVREVKRLRRAGFSQTAKAVIGYADILDFLAGKRTLDETVFEIKKRTRHLAKKQLTWFRRDARIHWIPVKGNRFAVGAVREMFNVVRQVRSHEHGNSLPPRGGGKRWGGDPVSDYNPPSLPSPTRGEGELQ